jgi:serine dehydrogenase proteinase
LASTWAKVLTEIDEQRKVPGKKVFWARVLEQKIRNVFAHTNRPLIIYGSACTVPGKKSRPEDLMIDVADKVGFHDVIENLPGPNLDIIIHSPGGYPEAAESLVEEVRRKFSHIRFLIPLYAKSAATMMVMSGDEILLDEDAELGPIDPQMITTGGVSPAEAIKEQFQKAERRNLF